MERMCDSCEQYPVTTCAVAPDGAVFYLCEGCTPAGGQGFVITELEDDER